MAWNEPGNSKDPWGSGGGSGSGGNKGNDGPPDLDEVVKKIQQGFGGLLGNKRPESPNGGGGGTSTPFGNGPGLVVIGIIGGILLALWLATGFYTVAPAERGVVLRLGAHDRTTQPGLNWHIPAPFERVIKVNVDRISSFSHQATMLTRDENIVDVELTIQSRIEVAEHFLFHDQNPEKTLRDVTETVVREAIGKSNLDFILTAGRAAIADTIRNEGQGLVNQYRTGLMITSVNMQPARPPEPVKDAFDDAIKAREDKERLENQAEAYRNAVVPQARGEAARIMADAEAYKEKVIAEASGESERFIAVLGEYHKAPEVTRERLYIDTMEQVLGNSSRVIVDVANSNNLMYLPLDRMINPTRTSGNPLHSENPLTADLGRSRLPSSGDAVRPVDRSRGATR